jgi:hypothetical protein
MTRTARAELEVCVAPASDSDPNVSDRDRLVTVGHGPRAAGLGRKSRVLKYYGSPSGWQPGKNFQVTVAAVPGRGTAGPPAGTQ